MATDSETVRNLGEQLDELLYRWDEIRRRPAIIFGGCVGALVLVGLAWLLTQRTSADPGPPIEDRIPVVSLAPAVPPTTEPQRVVVHVAGAVRTPGVYELAPGDRVLDALNRAGGPTPDGQPDRLNLAAPVQDGMQIRVPVEGEAGVVVGPANGATSSGPLDLNAATAPQLETLPGVGPSTSAAIVSYRDEVGQFGSVSDLLGVRGIGEAKLAALEGLVTVG